MDSYYYGDYGNSGGSGTCGKSGCGKSGKSGSKGRKLGSGGYYYDGDDYYGGKSGNSGAGKYGKSGSYGNSGGGDYLTASFTLVRAGQCTSTPSAPTPNPLENLYDYLEFRYFAGTAQQCQARCAAVGGVGFHGVEHSMCCMLCHCLYNEGKVPPAPRQATGDPAQVCLTKLCACQSLPVSLPEWSWDPTALLVLYVTSWVVILCMDLLVGEVSVL